MSKENVGWGDPCIHGELQMLGINISQSTISKYVVQHRKQPSHTWRTFLTNHADSLPAIDFFTILTATFRILYVFIALSHVLRQIMHFYRMSIPQFNGQPSRLWRPFRSTVHHVIFFMIMTPNMVIVFVRTSTA